MIARLTALTRHPLYWIAIVLTGLSMEGVALYYQYALDYGPCTLCTHIRAWVLAIVLVASLTLFVRRYRYFNGLGHLIMLGLSSGLLYSSWQTLGVERGWFEGSCEFGAGYPSWLPLHEWWPEVFEAWELCGYTPELLFGVTFAETLMVGAPLMVIFFILATFASLRNSEPSSFSV
jgi:disulfide bond formation protein DsbB